MQATGAVFLSLLLLKGLFFLGAQEGEASPKAELSGISWGPAGLRGELQVRIWSRNWLLHSMISPVPVTGLGQEEVLGTGHPHAW